MRLHRTAGLLAGLALAGAETSLAFAPGEGLAERAAAGGAPEETAQHGARPRAALGAALPALPILTSAGAAVEAERTPQAPTNTPQAPNRGSAGSEDPREASPAWSAPAPDGGWPVRPNILWITVEDMSPWLGCYGDPVARTPRVDALAAEGLRYTNAHATTPVCAPARAALITGCYATRIGAMHMRTGNPSKASLDADPEAYAGIPSYEATPPPEVRCFPELLRSAGYWCTNRAKTDYQFKAPATVWDQSGGKAHWRNRPDPEQPFFAVFNLGVTHESGTFERTRPQPAVTDPAQVEVPPYYPDTPAVREVLARTYDNIAAMDQQVGNLLDQLEEDGLADSTIVFWFTDHGVGLPRGKRAIYASGTHVPLVVRAPGLAPGVTDRLLSFIDLAPTVLSIAGLATPEWMDGSAVLGEHAAPPPPFVFLHADRMDAELDRTRAVTDGRYRLVWNGLTDRPRLYPVAYAEGVPLMPDLHALAERGGDRPEQWQLVDRVKPPLELYDRRSDPHEVHNLAAAPEHAERVSRLRVALEGWMARTGDLGLLPELEMVRTRLWPGAGEQPRTAAPTLVTGPDGVLTLQCATDGASLGWRLPGQEGWRPWDTLPRAELAPGATLEAFAHRIGFKPSAAVTLRVPG
jgi:N-sulfoglucosamine sulfohydrolase